MGTTESLQGYKDLKDRFVQAGKPSDEPRTTDRPPDLSQLRTGLQYRKENNVHEVTMQDMRPLYGYPFETRTYEVPVQMLMEQIPERQEAIQKALEESGPGNPPDDETPIAWGPYIKLLINGAYAIGLSILVLGYIKSKEYKNEFLKFVK